METFAITTDVHLDRFVEQYNGRIYENSASQAVYDRLNSVEADYLIICGDIAQRECLPHVFNKIKPSVKAVLFVEGNHEYIESNLDKPYEHELPDHVHRLKRGEVFITDGGKRIGGDTLWSNVPVSDEMAIQLGMPEYSAITNGRHLTVYDTKSMFFETKEFIFNNDLDIVVTHHMPSRIMRNPAFDGSVLNSAFYSNLDEKMSFDKSIKLWACGHSHYRINEEFFGMQLVNSPYPMITKKEV